MKRYSNHFVFIFLVLTTSATSTFAEEVLIKAVIGDKTSQFLLKSEKNTHILLYQTNVRPVIKVKIQDKNFQYVVHEVNDVIFAQSAVDDKKTADCLRDQTLVQYTNDSGKISSTKVCLLAKTKKSESLLNLIKTISAVLKN